MLKFDFETYNEKIVKKSDFSSYKDKQKNIRRFISMVEY